MNGLAPTISTKHMAARDLPDVLDLLPDAVFVVGTAGRLIAVHGACQRIFGYQPEEMIGKPMMDFVFPGDRAKTLQTAKRVMDGHCEGHFENRYVRKDGRLAHILWSARWSEVDKVRVGVARDITEHGQAELARTEFDAAPRWRLSSSPPRLTPPGSSPIPLSIQDYKVLQALANGGECVTRQTIVSALGKNFIDYDQRRLDTQMHRLRRKVEEASGLQLPVTTWRSVGYQFYGDLEVGR